MQTFDLTIILVVVVIILIVAFVLREVWNITPEGMGLWIVGKFISYFALVGVLVFVQNVEFQEAVYNRFYAQIPEVAILGMGGLFAVISAIIALLIISLIGYYFRKGQQFRKGKKTMERAATSETV